MTDADFLHLDSTTEPISATSAVVIAVAILVAAVLGWLAGRTGSPDVVFDPDDDY